MKYTNSIQIKALILLLVFSLNTITGFACAVGMEFHTQDHENTVAILHQHEKGNAPHQHGKANESHLVSNADNIYPHPIYRPDGKDNCCNDSVLQFAKIDKTAVSAVNTNFGNTDLVALIHIFYLSDSLSISQVAKHLPLVRWCFPPPHNIRVSIRSLQI